MDAREYRQALVGILTLTVDHQESAADEEEKNGRIDAAVGALFQGNRAP